MLIGIAGGLFVNPVIFAIRVDRSLSTFPWVNTAALLALSLGLFALALAFGPFWKQASRAASQLAQAMRPLSQEPIRSVLLAVAFVAVGCGWLECVAFQVSHSPKHNEVWILVLLQRAFLHSAPLVMVLLLVGYFSRLATILLSVPLLLPLVAEWLSLTHGVGRLNLSMIKWINWGAAGNLLRPSLILPLAIWIVLLGVGVFFVLRAVRVRRWKILPGVAVVWLAVLLTNPAFHAIELRGAFSGAEAREDLRWTRHFYFENAWQGSPFCRLGAQLVAPPHYQVLQANEVPELLAKSQNAGPTETSPHIRPFSNIILVYFESLSRQFTHSAQGEWPSSLTPFLDSLTESRGDIYTLSAPTLRGLSTHFCSHPNAAGLITLKHPRSVIRALNAAGWNTTFFESDERTFEEQFLAIPSLGFKALFDCFWQMENGRAKYKQDWGICDASTFEVVVEYLKKNRGRNNFVSVSTLDSHLPAGRTAFPHLSYPKEPDFVLGNPSESYWRALFRSDENIRRFITSLDENDLLDEDTIIIVTADHACPPFSELMASLKNPPPNVQQPIPWFVFTKRKEMPAFSVRPASQCDTAPTIAHLAGLSPDPAWWGTSLYSDYRKTPLLYLDNDLLYRYEDSTRSFVPEHDKTLWAAFHTFVKDEPSSRTTK